jgi:tRNA U55 pseudouridine synthase TruB
VDDAVTLETDASLALARLRPLEEAVAELRRVIVTEEEARQLRQGQALPREGLEGSELALFDGRNRLAATAKWDAETRMIRPDKVFQGPKSLWSAPEA